MFIQTEATPNPDTIKFIPGQPVLVRGTADFDTEDLAGMNSPLAARLFKVQGVARVFLAQEFISITKDANTDWSMLKPMAMAAIMEHLSTAQPIVHTDFYTTGMKGVSSASDGEGDDSDDGTDSEIIKQIKELLDTRVRPAVAMDGGDIVFDRFDTESGIVYLKMQGACAGCPSSTATLKVGIENMLRHYVPEVNEVRPVDYF